MRAPHKQQIRVLGAAAAAAVLQKTLLVFENAHEINDPAHAVPARKMHDLLLRAGATARLLLLTATPMDHDPMHLVQLLNLICGSQLPATYDEFKRDFLTVTGEFSDSGKVRFLDCVAGTVSFLDRETAASGGSGNGGGGSGNGGDGLDVQQVQIPMVADVADIAKFDSVYVQRYAKSGIAALKRSIEQQVRDVESQFREAFEDPANVQTALEDAVRMVMVEAVNNGGDGGGGAAAGRQVRDELVRKSVQQCMADTRKYADQIRDLVRSVQAALRNAQLFRIKELQRLNEQGQSWTDEDNAKFEAFIKSPYFLIKSKCSRHQQRPLPRETDVDDDDDDDELRLVARTQFPDLDVVESEMEEVNARIFALENDLDAHIAAYGARMQDINRRLRQSDWGSPAERSAFIEFRRTEKSRMAAELRQFVQEKKQRIKHMKSRRNALQLRSRGTRRRAENIAESEKERVDNDIERAKQALLRTQAQMMTAASKLNTLSQQRLEVAKIDLHDKAQTLAAILK